MNKRASMMVGFSLVMLTAATAFAYTYTTQVTMKFADDVGSANNSGTLVIGNSTGRQLGIDDNEVQARAANGGPSTLYLNHAGGLTRTGGDVEVAGHLTSAYSLIFPSAGTIYANGAGVMQLDDESFYLSVDFTQVLGGTFLVSAQTELDGPVIMAPSFVGGNAVCLNPPYADGKRQLGICSSSARFKTDIASLSSGLKEVMAMRPVTYAWKADGRRDLGFIAEEAAEVRPELVVRGTAGEVAGFDYQHYTAVLTRAVQEQQSLIDNLRQQLDSQHSELTALRTQMSALAKTVADQRGAVR